MLIRRKWFPLLFTGLFASSFLALYFIKVENGRSSSFEKMSCKQPTTLSKENGKFDLHFVLGGKRGGLYGAGSEQSGFKSWARQWVVSVLGQDTLLSQCLASTRSINGYRRI